MSFREDAVKAFARLMGVGSPLEKGAVVPPQASSPAQQAGGLPAEWVTSTYAPGWPIQPIERPEDVTIPREIDYPLAVNATLQPRTAYGLMPFAALKEAYETVSEIRLPVTTLLREMTIFRPHMVDKEGGEILNHPYEWLVKSPDRVSSFDVWVTRFLKSALVFDAGAFYIQSKGSDIEALRYIDGSTLFIMVDEHGQVPAPNDVSKNPEVQKRYIAKAKEWIAQGKSLPRTTPAFAQVIKGTPFGWYDTNQIWYKPRSRRYDSPYGETAIEQAWSWILICANITGFELAHYREGNMPEGWVSAPEGWSLERIAAFEQAFNQRMSSGATERMRSRFLPFGTEWHETKKPDFPQQLYDQAAHTISLFFGVPPSEYGKVPGSGLGGAGFETAMQSTLFRMGLYPLKSYVESALNEILKRAGVDDARAELAFPASELDPSKHKENVIQMFGSGLITLNHALGQLGQDRIEGGDVHLLISGGNATKLEDFLNSDKAVVSPTTFGDEATPPSEGTFAQDKPTEGKPPVGDPTERKEPMTPDDKKLAEKILQTASLNPDGKFWSIPSTVVSKEQHRHVPAHPRDPYTQQFASKGRVSSEDAKRIAVDLGVDLNQISLEQFRVMVEGEANEHPTIVGEDLNIAGRIAVDHLNQEDEDNIAKVASVQKKSEFGELAKHCGVCPGDDDYYGAPITRDAKVVLPNDDKHKNDVEIVAITPDGLEPRPGLWKPEGGEQDVLQERVGGALYLREEAAYLLDRSLNFNLVPLAYVGVAGDENGAVIHYTSGTSKNETLDEYDETWSEKAAVLDYIMGQLDRHKGNYLTHPDDVKRMVLIDNGVSFPVEETKTYSPFYDIWAGKPLSAEVLRFVLVCVNDAATWADIEKLIGAKAADAAMERAEEVLQNNSIPAEKVAKGGPGSGRYPAGSGGGKGKSGGGGIQYTENGYQGFFARQVDKMSDVPTPDGEVQYLRDADGKMYHAPNGHYDGIKDLKGDDYVEGLDEEQAEEQFIRDGGMRVEYTNIGKERNAIFQTADNDVKTLRQLQRMYDKDQIDLPAKGVVNWDGINTREQGVDSWYGSTTDFLNAKYVRTVTVDGDTSIVLKLLSSDDELQKGGPGSGRYPAGSGGGKKGSRGSYTVKGSAGEAWQNFVLEGTTTIDRDLFSAVSPNIVICDTIYDGLDVPKNAMWDRAGGGYNPETNEVVIPWKKVSGGELGIQSSTKAAGIIRHEFGHAADQEYENEFGTKISELPQFTEEFESESKVFLSTFKDAPMVTPAVNYFIKGSTAQSEFVAETVAYLNGGVPTYGMAEIIGSSFQNTLGVVQGALEELVEAKK